MENNSFESDIEILLKGYRPSPATIELVRDTPLVLLVGISGAGKNTVKDELLKRGGYHYIVSHTTRQPRVNDGVLEQNGREYHFITLAQSADMLRNGAYVEAKQYGVNIYGTSVSEIQQAHDAQQVALADIEVQGVGEYMQLKPDVTAIFLLPPSYEVWQARLMKRSGGAMEPADFAKRMQTARRELGHALETPGFHFVVNDSLAEVVTEIHEIATTAGETPTEAKYARTVASDLCVHLDEFLASSTVV